MPSAARVGDITNHGGTVIGPGASSVLISGQPAAVVGDTHVCSLPPISHQPTASVFPSGSTTVFIQGISALRTTDTCLCGAMVVIGDPTIIVN